ncbi:hypothetical protein GCM10020367_45070 [Streptomyces sannanensis]|uniref:Membrane protein YndG n=1 Tax=Streptomyces sannanensis TaxID=285536 RepID=A0ABP6SGA5_9ACTN
MRLYIETRIRADLDLLWERTQQPAQHQRWDLRFTEIDYLPRAEGEPQHFRYTTRLLPFLAVSGTGVAAGERHRPDGARTSALRFSSPHPLSLIEEGSGYWKYVPDGEGVRFLTGYDYRPRWGWFGAIADRLVFRPLMGWATAWSFDRLRLWCERGITPARSLAHALAETAVRLAAVTAVLWDGGRLMIPLLARLFPFLGYGAPLIGLVLLPLALFLPPLPGTPAARRCLRAPALPRLTPLEPLS